MYGECVFICACGCVVVSEGVSLRCKCEGLSLVEGVGVYLLNVV